MKCNKISQFYWLDQNCTNLNTIVHLRDMAYSVQIDRHNSKWTLNTHIKYWKSKWHCFAKSNMKHQFEIHSWFRNLCAHLYFVLKSNAYCSKAIAQNWQIRKIATRSKAAKEKWGERANARLCVCVFVFWL